MTRGDVSGRLVQRWRKSSSTESGSDAVRTVMYYTIEHGTMDKW